MAGRRGSSIRDRYGAHDVVDRAGAAACSCEPPVAVIPERVDAACIGGDKTARPDHASRSRRIGPGERRQNATGCADADAVIQLEMLFGKLDN